MIEELMDKLLELTKELIIKVKVDKDYEETLQRRETVIEKIKELNLDKDTICHHVNERNILKYEQEAVNIISLKKKETKDKMFMLRKNTIANKTYGKVTGLNILNKKI